MRRYEVSQLVNSPKNDVPACADRVSTDAQQLLIADA